MTISLGEKESLLCSVAMVFNCSVVPNGPEPGLSIFQRVAYTLRVHFRPHPEYLSLVVLHAHPPVDGHSHLHAQPPARRPLTDPFPALPHIRDLLPYESNAILYVLDMCALHQHVR
ncbi:hypothetical protein PHYPO_G00121060 [Pangasianodon hypophthalmus]|uniref:Uncharacterized protein n=1 Tax=Pangasianodon hypophthalmus TaxID=310915 RepID=A0A5N5KYZ2_PANHP|nr:hypothetical protein PHYPO_G00121060 [Pangasianodon hypophthalmus]